MSKYQQKINSLEGYFIRGDKQKPVTSEDIKQIESELGYSLPNDYVEFLINYGGFAFNCYVIYPLLEPCPIGDMQGLDVFFGVLPNDTYDIIGRYQGLKDRIPSNFLPIARDGMGNHVCLSVNGDDKGYVYFWQHDAEVLIDDDENSGYVKDIYLAARSFDEFIDSLERDDYE